MMFNRKQIWGYFCRKSKECVYSENGKLVNFVKMVFLGKKVVMSHKNFEVQIIKVGYFCKKKKNAKTALFHNRKVG